MILLFCNIDFRKSAVWILLSLTIMVLVTSIVAQTNFQQPYSNQRSQTTSASDQKSNIFGYNSFDHNLIKGLERSSLSSNFIVSPLSIKFLLVILYEAASSTTKDELANVLELFGKPNITYRSEQILRSLKQQSSDYLLNFGSRMYVDSGITPNKNYRSLLAYSYDTDIVQLTFSQAYASKNEINNWVQNVTNGKVNVLVTESDVDNSVILLLNAIFYKGLWNMSFSESETVDGKFYVTPSNTKDVKYMKISSEFHYLESRQLQAKVLRLPYKGDKFAMYLFLPDSKTGLNKLINDLYPNNVNNLYSFMDKVTVDVTLPKFNFEYTSRLSPILREMGVNDLFGINASLPSLARGTGYVQTPLVVSNVLQKAGVEINEKGTVAFAATEIQLENKFGSSGNFFNATHPFLFMIADEKEGTILFIGKVENPLETSGDYIPDSKWPNNPFSTAGKEPQSHPISSLNPQNMHEYTENIEGAIANREGYPVSSFGLAPELDKFRSFDLEILKKLYDATSENILLSPVSIKSLLTMVYEGARGRTSQEIQNVLHFPNDRNLVRNYINDYFLSLKTKSNGVVVQSGNKIYHSNKIVPKIEYEKTVRKYDASVESIDFMSPDRAAYEINNWVSSATRGAIPKFIDQGNLDPNTKIMLLNALYFKGIWKHTFPEEDSILKCFYVQPDKCVNVTMMELIEVLNYTFLNSLDSHAVELPYKDERYSMILLVPNKVNGLPYLMEEIAGKSLSKIVSSMDDSSEVLVQLPKFKFDFLVDMLEILRAMGIKDLFSQRADLGAISNDSGLLVNSVLHKTTILVNEEGSTAAAISGASIIPLMGTNRPFVRADHPFVFFIYDKSRNLVLFEGIINKPIL